MQCVRGRRRRRRQEPTRDQIGKICREKLFHLWAFDRRAYFDKKKLKLKLKKERNSYSEWITLYLIKIKVKSNQQHKQGIHTQSTRLHIYTRTLFTASYENMQKAKSKKESTAYPAMRAWDSSDHNAGAPAADPIARWTDSAPQPTHCCRCSNSRNWRSRNLHSRNRQQRCLRWRPRRRWETCASPRRVHNSQCICANN